MADDEIGSVRDGSTSDHDEKTAVREEDAAPKPSNAAAVRERPYSVFTTKEKWFLVVLCGIAAMFRFVRSLRFWFIYATERWCVPVL